MLAESTADDLIGRIYDDVSATAPWQRTLSELRDAVGAQTLVLQMTVDRQPDRPYFVAAGLRTEPGHIAEWERRSRDQQISLALPPGRVLTCNDYMSYRPRDGFADLIRRYDVARGMSAQIVRRRDAEYSLHALRPGREVPFGEEEERMFARLLPHLARAIGLRAELSEARDDAGRYGEALSRVGVGMIRVDSDRRISAINDRAHANLSDYGLHIRNGLLDAEDPALSTRLTKALKQVLTTEGTDATRVATALAGQASALIQPTPMEDGTIGRRMPAATLLVVSAPVLDGGAVEALREMFGLTVTEAAIGVHLAMGRGAREVQDVMGIRYTTLRTHMAQLFVKLDCTRQSELVRRLALVTPVLQ